MTASATTTLSAVNRWLVILLLMGFAAIGHFNRIGISVAGDEVFIRSESEQNVAPVETSAKAPAFAKVFTETEMGLVYSAFLVVYTIGMMPGGWLIDRIGAAKALTLLGLSMGTFVALTGTLGWLMSTPNQLWLGLLVIRGLAGLCSAPLHPGAAHVVTSVISANGRATANGFVTAGALLGIAISLKYFGNLMDNLTWQWAFVVSGLAMILYGVLWSKLTAQKVPGPTGTRIAEQLPVTSQPVVKPAVPWQLMKQSDLWLVMLSYVAYGYFQYLFFYWMGYYFKQVLHVPIVESRDAVLLITVAQGAGMAIGGLSTDIICRVLGIARGRRAIVLTGMSLSALFALIAVNLNESSQITWCLALAMAAQGLCEGVFWTTATDIGGQSRGVAGAFMNTGGNVGGFISPALTPFLAKSIGWPGAITVACGICALGGLIWFWIKLPDSTPAPISTAASGPN